MFLGVKVIAQRIVFKLSKKYRMTHVSCLKRIAKELVDLES